MGLRKKKSLIDVKDFRVYSDYPVVIDAEDVEALLCGGGVPMEHLKSLRIRIKDMDPRFMLSKMEPIDDDCTVWRLNLYLPVLADKPSDRYYVLVNEHVRHDVAHMAQMMKHPPGLPPDEETVAEYEEEAEAFSEDATGFCVLRANPVEVDNCH